MLDDIAPVDYPCRALLNKRFGAFEDFLIRRLTASSNKNRYPSGNLNDFVIQAHVVRRIRFDDIGAQFDGLPHQREDLDFIAINHVTASDCIRAKNKRLNHQWHSIAVTLWFDLQDIPHALIGHLRLVGDQKEIHDDTSGIQSQRLLDRMSQSSD